MVLLLVASVTPTSAIDLEKLVMPGPLSQAHAEFEADCSRCHEAFREGAEPKLCGDCHEVVASDVANRRGFHGLHPGAVSASCRSCHSEHRGRNEKLVQLDRNGFNHDFTNHPLRGAHVSLECEQCHVAQTPFREAPAECFACHEADDSHAGKMGPKCGDCHGESSWSAASFDHSTTSFPLKGGHSEVQCAVCHPAERYADTPTSCAACHGLDDAHSGRFGTGCETCHSTAAWSAKSSFDHAREAQFPLLGAHASAACVSCHNGPLEKQRLGKTCNACHGGEDVHNGMLGPTCNACHSESSWKRSTFDHGRDAGFALMGAHEKVPCAGCHRADPKSEKLQAKCAACHASDDVHEARLGTDCAECHSQTSFTGRVVFDHELTRFPLLGLHAAAPCEACHTDRKFAGTPVDCATCHGSDDVHEQKLGVDCQRCHNPNDWQRWHFDHAREASFDLEGRHAGLSCSSCHRQPISDRVRAPRDCEGCHRRDDDHRGAFGRNCGDCHSAESWKAATIGR